MKISTRLYLAGLSSLAVVVVTGAVLLSATRQVKQELTKNAAAAEILDAVHSVRYLTLEYVLRHEDRVQAQWQLRYASLTKLLMGTAVFTRNEEQEILASLRQTHESVNKLFVQLVTTHQDREAGKEQSPVLGELEARLTGQIMNRTQAKISDALSLSEQSRAGVLAAQQRASVAVVVFGGIVALVIAATLFLILKSVIWPLAKLREGTAIVGAGNLDFRLDVMARDEIGELARAFDRMTEKLKGTTVSRDELVNANQVLQSEIAARRQAEQKAQAQLERLNLLHQITRATGERQDLQSIFQVVIRSVEDDLPIDFGCVCLREGGNDALTVACVGARSEPLAFDLALTEHARVAIDENGLSRCVRGQLVYEPDITQVPMPFPQRLAGGGLRSIVMAPLLAESQVFGLLVAARCEPHSFSSGECEFLRQLSEHVALAAHQAQLHGALQQAYDDLRQTQQAVMQQERLRALGQMASGIAHDINNAISPIALYTESLLEKEPNLSVRARGYLETIQRAIDDVAKTVARMREFYRQREPQLTLGPVHLNSLAQQVVDLTRARWHDMPQQSGRVIRLVSDFTPDPPAIMGIESEIREALINLIFNAVDAMPEGGTLTVRTRAKQAEPDANGSIASRQVEVAIVDSGVGMDEDTRRRCLEPFFTTKGERGTGLGLAMVYGVVQRHSAEIEIDSTPSKGTSVRLVFFVSESTIAATDRSAAGNAVPPRQRILVVDDDPLLLKSLRDTLEADGHVVVAANGGQAGIDAFTAAQQSEKAFTVVITDLGMPHVDGRRVASAVTALSPSTPVILLTGWGQRLIASGDVPANVNCVLSKPPRLRELREALAHSCLPTEA
jgi:signal transduction histidine kinase/CheY-like chemotaxis protein/HAMP domain-containing protein